LRAEQAAGKGQGPQCVRANALYQRLSFQRPGQRRRLLLPGEIWCLQWFLWRRRRQHVGGAQPGQVQRVRADEGCRFAVRPPGLFQPAVGDIIVAFLLGWEVKPLMGFLGQRISDGAQDAGGEDCKWPGFHAGVTGTARFRVA
jgi:hypothetical protein